MTSIALAFTLDLILNFGGQVQGNGFPHIRIICFAEFLCSGGKTGAPSIQNDIQFTIAIQALLKRDKSKTQVSVEFDIDAMEGFRIKQVVCIFICTLLTCTYIS